MEDTKDSFALDGNQQIFNFSFFSLLKYLHTFNCAGLYWCVVVYRPALVVMCVS